MMRQFTYRRRQDAGLTRVWVGRRRRRIIEQLLRQGGPETVDGIALAARVRYDTADAFLNHLSCAGLVTGSHILTASGGGDPDEWTRCFHLTAEGRQELTHLISEAPLA